MGFPTTGGTRSVGLFCSRSVEFLGTSEALPQANEAWYAFQAVAIEILLPPAPPASGGEPVPPPGGGG